MIIQYGDYSQQGEPAQEMDIKSTGNPHLEDPEIYLITTRPTHISNTDSGDNLQLNIN